MSIDKLRDLKNKSMPRSAPRLASDAASSNQSSRSSPVLAGAERPSSSVWAARKDRWLQNTATLRTRRRPGLVVASSRAGWLLPSKAENNWTISLLQESPKRQRRSRRKGPERCARQGNKLSHLCGHLDDFHLESETQCWEQPRWRNGSVSLNP
jgi:hypothetical protein